jgi:hypothetical protein
MLRIFCKNFEFGNEFLMHLVFHYQIGGKEVQ